MRACTYAFGAALRGSASSFVPGHREQLLGVLALLTWVDLGYVGRADDSGFSRTREGLLTASLLYKVNFLLIWSLASLDPEPVCRDAKT